jgi:hypothetical protein
MLEQLFLVQLPQQILIFRPEPSWHSPALEFKLKNLSYIHSLNKTKQPFLQPFTVFVSLGQFAKNFKNKF